MKKIMKILALVLALVLLAGCDSAPAAPTTEAPASKDADYTVTVADALGTPYTSGVIVRFMQGGQQAAMQAVNENGVAVKTLPRGDYAVELLFTGDEAGYHYEKEGLNLTAEQTELTVELAVALTGTPDSLHVQGQACDAYAVEAGCSYVPLAEGKRNYFLFAPTVAGTYEIAMKGEGTTIGYYGAPHFVQELNAAEVVDNRFTMSIRADMIGTGDTGTTVLVIGVDAQAGTTDGILTIERTGEPQWSIADEPWFVYETTAELSKYTLPAGAVMKEFDLKAATGDYNLVYNEADGFYHLDSADGPLVLMRLGEKSKYVDCFQTILDRSNVCKYFYDENGEFIKRETYADCLFEYFEYMDEAKGVYPLTEDLKYILQQHGDNAGWFDPEGKIYLFVDQSGNKIPGINPEISWLFMCCYIEK